MMVLCFSGCFESGCELNGRTTTFVFKQEFVKVIETAEQLFSETKEGIKGRVARMWFPLLLGEYLSFGVYTRESRPKRNALHYYRENR